ncbi:hypothetical protein ACPVTF_02980 [Geobacillus icigianus]|uniref:Uncharacterized protein n=1 Tax=Geobacillus subterraneus TaxID=129338 RepID=A0A679FUT1_9BACL|nr:hypothetical protein [Geobacillus subterraneus]BBW97466.1 hypothetical protein GsuE55_22990 [Geobacillus subterraneus]
MSHFQVGDERIWRPWWFWRPYGFPFFGAPFFSGFLGGLLGSALFPPFFYPYWYGPIWW